MKKLIELHEEWMKSGQISDTGLCLSIPRDYREYLELFRPSQDELRSIDNDNKATIYWSSDLYFNDENRLKAYTPLRQTIVLLICAMHDEI